MFNKTNFDAQDLPGASSSNSMEEIGGVTEPSDDHQSYPSQIHHSNDHQILLDDAKVPIVGQMYLCLDGFSGNAAGTRV